MITLYNKALRRLIGCVKSDYDKKIESKVGLDENKVEFNPLNLEADDIADNLTKRLK